MLCGGGKKTINSVIWNDRVGQQMQGSLVTASVSNTSSIGRGMRDLVPVRMAPQDAEGKVSAACMQATVLRP